MEEEYVVLTNETNENLPTVQPSEESWISAPTLVRSVSILGAMFVTAFIFMVVALYYDRFKTRRYKTQDINEWNKKATAFALPWQLFPIRGFSDYNNTVNCEKNPLLSSSKYSIINMYMSKNKADSKYPKIKRKFAYFVTIPEEEEDNQSTFVTS